jgi:bZIP factor
LHSDEKFIIRARAPGWWAVQRDPTGSGILDIDLDKHGWVPAGCLLETNVPVASAIATAAKSGSSGSSSGDSLPEMPVSKMPILPLSIISTSLLAIGLMDYKKKEEEKLDLVKDDAVRVFKRYNHWSYVSLSSFPMIRRSDNYGRCLLGCQGGRRRSRLGTCMYLAF